MAVHRAVKMMAEMKPERRSNRRGRAQELLKTVTFWSYVVGLCVTSALFPMAAVRLVRPLSSNELSLVLAVFLVGEAGFIVSFLASVLAHLITALPGHRRYALDCSREWLGRFNHAALLRSFSTPVLDAVDQLFNQRIKRFERAQVRVVGGADKLSLIALAGMGWGLWKEASAAGNVVTLLLFVVTGVLLFLLVAGNLIASTMTERLRYYRDVIALARLGRA